MIIDDRYLYNPIDRFIERYLPSSMDLQDEAGHLRILAQHHIYSGTAELPDADLVRRDNRGL